MRLSFAAAAAVCTLAVGCSGDNQDGISFARVSGRITINGEPAPGIEVSFNPIMEDGALLSGPVSSARTDTEGRYTLITTSGKSRPAAVVGRHDVVLQTVTTYTVTEETGAVDAERLSKFAFPPEAGVFEFTVPPGGTDAADFNVENAAVEGP
ncbi:MAG: hypothetical protein AAF532_09415 [Planctomycetota bacterium]